MKVMVDGQACIVISRSGHYTKVLTPLHDVIEVRNEDTKEID